MVLKGMTWSHDRGLKPLLAASKEFNKIHPDVTIEWDARSLADFELFPLEQLADAYDFIMIDHPHIGTAYAQNLLLPLDTLIPSEFLDEQEENSVGRSHESYYWEGHQWALAADSAAQVSAWKPEVIKSLNIDIPVTWQEVMDLAANLPKGKKMVLPFVPVHAYSSFYSLASQITQKRVWHDGDKIEIKSGVEVLKLLESILANSDKDSYDMDPIQVLDRMADGDDLVYCPLTYGYSTYSLEGFRKSRVKFGNIPSDSGNPDGSMIGGVGLAISSKCKNVDLAVEFVKMVLSPEFQQTVFADNSGQPGHRTAWLNERINREYLDFYKDTLETLDWGSMRPRFNGYIEFQGSAGSKIREFIKSQRTDYEAFITELNDMYLDFYSRR